MTNRDRLIEALRGTAPDALSQELEFEMDGITNSRKEYGNEKI